MPKLFHSGSKTMTKLFSMKQFLWPLRPTCFLNRVFFMIFNWAFCNFLIELIDLNPISEHFSADRFYRFDIFDSVGEKTSTLFLVPCAWWVIITQFTYLWSIYWYYFFWRSDQNSIQTAVSWHFGWISPEPLSQTTFHLYYEKTNNVKKEKFILNDRRLKCKSLETKNIWRY